MSGYVYLIHFDRPIAEGHPCQHYIGWAKSLTERLEEHAQGRGARLLAVARSRGVGWRCIRVWYGDRALERRLKSHRNAPRYCPVCAAESGGAMEPDIPPLPPEERAAWARYAALPPEERARVRRLVALTGAPLGLAVSAVIATRPATPEQADPPPR